MIWTMSTAETILTQKRDQIATLEQALAVAQAELRGMEALIDALQLQLRSKPLLKVGPPPSAAATGALSAGTPSAGTPTSRSGGSGLGRQPGSISKRWRTILWKLDDLGGDFSPGDVAGMVLEVEGRRMKASEAARQLENYLSYGYVTGAGLVWNITNEFRAKFARSDGGSNENEPDSDNAAGPEVAQGDVRTVSEGLDQPIAHPASTS